MFDRTKCDCYGQVLWFSVNFGIRLYSRRHHWPKAAPQYFFSSQATNYKNQPKSVTEYSPK